MYTRQAIIGASAAIIASTGAIAADLGGNCCADLEERVAELEQTVARKGNRVMRLSVSGRVHKALMFHQIDEADRPKQSIIDGAHSQSRVNFTGSAKINSDLSASFRISIGVGGFEERTGESTTELDVRESYVKITSKSAGSLTIGLASTATDGIAELDLGETGIASVPLSLAPADSALLGVSLSSFDGSRAEVLRYTSPTLAGFVLDASWAGDNQVRDIALRWANEFGAFRIAAGAGWREDDGPLGLAPKTKTVAGSASVMHVPSGLFVSGSYAKQDIDGADGNIEVMGVRGGIVAKPFKAGATRFFVSYEETRKLFDLTTKPTKIGAGVIQDIDAIAGQIYASWYQLDDDGLVAGLTGGVAELGTTDVFLVGVKIDF